MNINDQVTVILTDFGKKILEDYYNHYKIYHEVGYKADLKSIYQCDKNGKYCTELWNLMNIFGKYMYMGSEQVFLNNKIYTD